MALINADTKSAYDEYYIRRKYITPAGEVLRSLHAQIIQNLESVPDNVQRSINTQRAPVEGTYTVDRS